MMKYTKLLFILPFFLSYQCDDEPEVIEDNLNEIGLLGRWEIADEVTSDVISDMLPKCCQFYEFKADDNKKDYKGLFIFKDSQGFENRGSFEVDLSNQLLILIDDDNDRYIYGFSINDSHLNFTFTFTENEIKYTQVWVRIE